MGVRWLVALMALGAFGCGEYVAYEAGPIAVTPGAGADALAEEVRAAFETAERLDHIALEGLLTRFVSDGPEGLQSFVDYDGLDGSPEAVFALQQYLGVLDLIDPAQLADPAERLAFWINAYNANVLWGVVQTYGGEADYSVSQTGFAFFKVAAYRVGGAVLSLDQIEQGIIRGDFDHPSVAEADSETRAQIVEWHGQVFPDGPVDARIHVALNCASLGCPDLLPDAPHAFRAETLDAQLDAAARRFVNNPVKGAGPDGVSALLVEFYPGDFEAAYGGWRGFVEAFRDADAPAVDFGSVIEYDWTLNILPE